MRAALTKFAPAPRPVAAAPANDRPANDRYAEIVVGGIRTACLSRAQLTALMIEDCLVARANPALAPKLVFATNGNAVATAALDKRVAAQFTAADIVHADGQPIVTASRLFAHTPISERSATTDFLHDAAKACVEQGLRLFLLGASEEVNAACAHILRMTYPGIQIVGRRNGYFGASEEAGICKTINESGADVVFVGLGMVAEQDFCLRNKAILRAGWLVTCGGCFNFAAGDYKRAPEWMQDSGLEWLHRLMCEPRRLFRRYAVTNTIAIFLLLTRTYAPKAATL